MSPSRVTATSLAMHTHLQCDLYLHQTYHGMSPEASRKDTLERHESPAAVSLAAFAKGHTWESSFFTHLEQLDLLLTNSGPPLSGVDIASIITLDSRLHFFVAGLAFSPPSHRLAQEYAKYGVKAQNVPRFGLAKPDLLEIWRKDGGGYVWRIIDAKASKDVKTSHLVQTYFYHLCLAFILPPSFIPAPTIAVWLPSGNASSNDLSAPIFSLANLHPTPIAPLVPSLTDLIFIRLPAILSTARSDVSWHVNPLCRSCPFSSSCCSRAKKEGRFGRVGEISLSDVGEIRGFMKLASGVSSTLHECRDVEIEDLVTNMDSLAVKGADETITELAQLRGLLQDEQRMDYMTTRWPDSMKKVRRILAIRPPNKPYAHSSLQKKMSTLHSPVIEAALRSTPQFTNRRIYTLPSHEDIAFYISLIIDPSRPESVSGISEFCVSTVVNPSFAIIARKYGFKPPRHAHGSVDDLVPIVSNCIRVVLDLHGQILRGLSNSLTEEHRDRVGGNTNMEDLPRTQFYMWSAREKEALQKHLVNLALNSTSTDFLGADSPEPSHNDDIRLCIGGLCEGASLLATRFQPYVLEGALLGFLGKGGKSKEDMKSIMQRLEIGMTRTDTVETMCQKIVVEIGRLRLGREHRDTGRKTVGLLPRVVVLKKELQRIVALPVPGWWDAKEAAQSLGMASGSQCPDEDELFRRYWQGEATNLKLGIEARNNTCQELVGEIRRRIERLTDIPELLVNRGRVLTADWVDVCRVDVLRKLFYMQQFEVLLKLQELWDRRIEGCPDAPVLAYRFTTTANGEAGDASSGAVQLHHFDLISGNLEVTPDHDRDRAFFDHILVMEDEDDWSDEPKGECHLPLEALFDDLCVSGLVFPLNRYTHSNWDEGQPNEVKNRLWVADIREVSITNRKTRVVLRTWSGTGATKALLQGKTYRLSPRLVDFNTTKILSTLVELDLQTSPENTSISDKNVPLFVELISRPKTFGEHWSHTTSLEPFGRRVVLDSEASLHRLYTELRDLGNENAGALVLKVSQRQAARRILSERLTVIWGPPGSGKSYTIALSLLRMVEIQARTRTLAPGQHQIILVAAMTHAAIQASLSQLRKIIGYYRCVPNLLLDWLDELHIEHVLAGSSHPILRIPAFSKSHADSGLKARTWIYSGTVYQLYTFGKRLGRSVDCVVIDEAGQLGLCAASLILRALSHSSGIWGGKVVVAGDREQLAPILSGKYPELGGSQRPLFGSVLDCLMGSDGPEDSLQSMGVTTPEDETAGTIVQLQENFRLNPDLGDFVQTLYKRAFKPQKAQAKMLATRLRRLEKAVSCDMATEKGRNLLISLSKAMLGQKQWLFEAPMKQDTRNQMELSLLDTHDIYSDSLPTPRPISLALVRLHVRGDPQGEMAYESHIHTEAKVAAVLVRLLEKACGEGDDIFVACPHRIQRTAVRLALSQWDMRDREEKRTKNNDEEELQRLIRNMGIDIKEEEDENELVPSIHWQHGETHVPVTVDTIERLQGSEASFVICLFSHTHRGSLATALPFLLTRRRLNVAISRTKTLCIVMSSEDVLRPGVSVFADRESAKGHGFLREFESRAWSTDMRVEIEKD